MIVSRKQPNSLNGLSLFPKVNKPILYPKGNKSILYLEGYKLKKGELSLSLLFYMLIIIYISATQSVKTPAALIRDITIEVVIFIYLFLSFGNVDFDLLRLWSERFKPDL